MKRTQPYSIEPTDSGFGGFVLTGKVARICRSSDGQVAGTLHRSWRNALGATPGIPVWWFCPTNAAHPVETSESSEAEIIAKALAWLALHDKPHPRRKTRRPQARLYKPRR